MSRIRSVHPGFFRDEDLVSCSAFARLLYIGLGVESDDKGIFEWKPVQIKMSVFPGDNVDVAALLEELVAAGNIMAFEAGGKRYGAIRNFRKYQKPKTPNDIYPMPDDIAQYVSFPRKEETDAPEQNPIPPKVEKAALMEDGGEGRVEEKTKPTVSPKRGTRWIKAQKVPDDWKQWAKAHFPSVDPYRLSQEYRKFEDYWPAKPGQAGLKLDWEATFHNWLRTAFPGEEIADSAAAEELVALRPDDPGFQAVQRARGKPVVVGKNGSATFTRAEVAAALERAA